MAAKPSRIRVRRTDTLKTGLIHGVEKPLHSNGVLASERPHVDGLLDGTSRQWGRKGKVPGTFRMRKGTGTQRYWHQNGHLRTEIPTKAGIPTGTIRRWKSDGTELDPIHAGS